MPEITWIMTTLSKMLLLQKKTQLKLNNLSKVMHACCLFSHVWLHATSQTVVHQIPQAKILEWIAMPFSRGSSPRNRTHICLCLRHCRQILSHWATWEAPVALTIQGQVPNNQQARYSTSSPSLSKASRLHQPDSTLALAGSMVCRPATLKHHERCRVSALERTRICI